MILAVNACFRLPKRSFSLRLSFGAAQRKIVYGNGNYLDRIRPLVISVSDLLLNEFSPFWSGYNKIGYGGSSGASNRRILELELIDCNLHPRRASSNVSRTNGKFSWSALWTVDILTAALLQHTCNWHMINAELDTPYYQLIPIWLLKRLFQTGFPVHEVSNTLQNVNRSSNVGRRA